MWLNKGKVVVDGGIGWGGGRSRRVVVKLEEMYLFGVWDVYRVVIVGMWFVLLRGLGFYFESNGKVLEGFKWYCFVVILFVENYFGYFWFLSESVRR